MLFVSFRTDVNSSFVGSVWGFRMTVRAMAPTAPEVVLAVLGSRSRSEIAAFHVVIMVLGAITLVAIASYGAYYYRQYPLFKETLLVVDDSPLETPDGSPFVQRKAPGLVASSASVSTLTEVLSMKSLKFGGRKGPSHASSYTRLAPKGELRKGVMRSLPSSPLTSTRGFSAMPFSRILRRGNAYKKQRNRRSASFDQLRTCVSPILEDKPLANSFTMEDIAKEDEKVYVALEGKSEAAERGEDTSSKYREHRKSLLASRSELDRLRPSGGDLEPCKLSKERLNREKAGFERQRRDAADGIIARASSSASEISVSGTEVDLEYDYYDYDVDNASAVPGSIFGMDPTLFPWMIDIDDLDIKSPDQLTSRKEEEHPFSLVSPPPPSSSSGSGSSSALKRPEEIPLKQFNILPATELLQNSSTSSNENNDDGDGDRTPTAESFSACNGASEDGSEREAPKKILNIHDVEDFQFADDDTEEEE